MSRHLHFEKRGGWGGAAYNSLLHALLLIILYMIIFILSLFFIYILSVLFIFVCYPLFIISSYYVLVFILIPSILFSFYYYTRRVWFSFFIIIIWSRLCGINMQRGQNISREAMIRMIQYGRILPSGGKENDILTCVHCGIIQCVKSSLMNLNGIKKIGKRNIGQVLILKRQR